MKLTMASVLALRPCYDEALLRELFGARESVTLSEALACGAVPPRDRLWLALRCWPRWLAQTFATIVAAAALPLYERRHPGDERPRRAIRVAGAVTYGCADDAAAYAAAYAANAAAAYAANAANADADAADAYAADAADAAAARAAARQRQVAEALRLTVGWEQRGDPREPPPEVIERARAWFAARGFAAAARG